MSEGKDNIEMTDMELARLVRDLPADMEPDRDLWAGVQRRILDHPQRQRREGPDAWMPWALAASLLVAISALTLNLVQMQPANVPLAGIDQINQEYMRIQNPMVEEFTRVNQSLDQKTLQDLYRNFEIMEQARLELEQQVKENPENHRLMEMLIRIHEQELELLRKDYSARTRTM